VQVVSPAVVWPGEPMVVVGQDLRDAQVWLGDLPTERLDARATTLQVRVPRTLPPGRHAVWLGAPGARVDTGVSIVARGDAPCDGVRANTTIRQARSEIVVQPPVGDPVRLDFADIARIESLNGPDCHAILLVRRAGGRVVFAEDPVRDLAPRARTVAGWLNVPVVDVVGPPGPPGSAPAD
jgi:hypothetical protein